MGELGGAAPSQLCHLLGIADVDGGDKRAPSERLDLRRDLVQRLLASAPDDDVGAGGRETHGQATPDSFAGTGDDGDAADQLEALQRTSALRSTGGDHAEIKHVAPSLVE
jgi:hypothetical protein